MYFQKNSYVIAFNPAGVFVNEFSEIAMTKQFLVISHTLTTDLHWKSKNDREIKLVIFTNEL